MEIKEMSPAELIERRAQIAVEIETADASRLDELEAEARAIKTELETRKAQEEQRNAVRDAVASGSGETLATFDKQERGKKMENREIRNSAEYVEAFATYCKTGNDKACRALLTENVSGVIPVPEFVGAIVEGQLKESKILRRVSRMTAAGNVKVSFEIAAPAATVHTEGGAAQAEEALDLGVVTLIAKTYKKWVGISDEALDTMSGRAYLEYIYREITRGIIKARENAVLAAILAAPQTATSTKPAVAKTGSAAGAITDIVDARALLSSDAADPVVILSPADYATYKGLQMSASYGVDPFDGLEVIFCDAATVPVIGDLSGVLENLPRGEAIEFKLDDKTRMKDDLVDILGRLPSAIEVIGNNYFAKVSA